MSFELPAYLFDVEAYDKQLTDVPARTVMPTQPPSMTLSRDTIIFPTFGGPGGGPGPGSPTEFSQSSAVVRWSNQDTRDLSERSSNITNGLGVFSGFTSSSARLVVTQ